MDFVNKLNEYFESDKFKNWFNITIQKFGYVSMKDVFEHAEEDGILSPGDFCGSPLVGWTYPCVKSKEES